jgi:hypothetical protein
MVVPAPPLLLPLPLPLPPLPSTRALHVAAPRPLLSCPSRVRVVEKPPALARVQQALALQPTGRRCRHGRDTLRKRLSSRRDRTRWTY